MQGALGGRAPLQPPLRLAQVSLAVAAAVAALAALAMGMPPRMPWQALARQGGRPLRPPYLPPTSSLLH